MSDTTFHHAVPVETGGPAPSSHPVYTPMPPHEFHFGITMAGAASAGCYTGGVMDYLFEILDLWERAKLPAGLPKFVAYANLIPQHSVIIDAMGGTSAGGMTSTMAAIYALNGDIRPVKRPGTAKELKGNLFYDSWVVMDDLNPNQ